ncbi:hypothetical protein [Nocardia sp. BMG51109]|uniref:hypothetical protein n=1 Tax=Nocardia sp. BMG51109 TaxID=1056816 RepID=UPI0004B9BE8F|nr:hypothetical protein [Nocardia sp. BMG51109]
MSNLAHVFTVEPHRSELIEVWQQGGWLDEYRDLRRASHNLRLDQVAAGLALRTALAPRLLLSDWTNDDRLAITPDSDLFRLMSKPDVPHWARWIAVSLERWCDRKPASKMHDPLLLSATLGLPFVRFDEVRVRIEPDARIYRDRRGRLMRVATDVDYAGFMAWLTDTIENGIAQFEL